MANGWRCCFNPTACSDRCIRILRSTSRSWSASSVAHGCALNAASAAATAATPIYVPVESNDDGTYAVRLKPGVDGVSRIGERHHFHRLPCRMGRRDGLCEQIRVTEHGQALAGGVVETGAVGQTRLRKYFARWQRALVNTGPAVNALSEGCENIQVGFMQGRW